VSLTREDLRGGAVEVAPNLLGALLVGETDEGEVAVRLTEVEAYQGGVDPGSHAFRGPTRRNAVMFGEAGHLYVYFTYGMHWCANVVCGPRGEAAAVLVRAGRVVRGMELCTLRRPGVRRVEDLARGPARLARCLGLGRDHDGTDLFSGGSPVRLGAGGPVPPERVRTGPRVGVAGPGGDGTSFPWRFWVEGDPTVSPYRAAVARPRRLPRAEAPPGPG
jgi:DNA-3-methyladenine glycosylase